MKIFFSKEQKEFALKTSRDELYRLYHGTENLLEVYARFDDESRLIETMRNHQLYEYALLYQLTPEYKTIVRTRLLNEKRRSK